MSAFVLASISCLRKPQTWVTIGRVTVELEQARQLAMTQRNGALAAVSASMSKAKLHRLLEERKRN
jgi:phage terminase small subunit